MQKKVQMSILLLLLTGALGAQNQPLFPQVPGMVSYTFRNSFSKDMASTLDSIKKLGITDMEFSNLFNRTALDIRKMLDERQMKCSSFGVNYPDLTTKTREVGQNAKTLGAKFVRVAWIPFEDDFNIDDAKKTVEEFNRVGKILKNEFDLNFCYHNHGYEFAPYENGTLFDYIVTHTNPNYVSFEMDILWTFFPGQNPVLILEKYPDRFKLLHLKDLRKGVEGNQSGKTPVENDVALGTGQLDIPSILKAAKKTSIEHYYIEDESPAYFEQVPKTMAYLKGLKY
jgi:sugar phosphate isomerase/epimerase